MIEVDSQMGYDVSMITRNCNRCDGNFFANKARIDKGGAIYCSRNCSNKSTSLKGEKSPHWVGDKVGYYGIHDWLYTNYGKACKCEKCGSNKKVQWAKIEGQEYERKRGNFWQLCTKCHIIYDDTIVKGGWNKGMKWSDEIKKRISEGTRKGMAKLK